MPATEKKQDLPQGSILNTLLDATGDLDTAEALQKCLPASLLKASTATLADIDQTARDLHDIQLKVDKDLAGLKPLHSFCINALNEALQRKWPAKYDVEQDLLSMPGDPCGCPPSSVKDGIETIKHSTQSLLQGAMQNFSEDEEGADAFPDGSVVRVKAAPGGVKDLTPAAFAAFCRELDLGRQYQEHFQQVFGLRDEDGKVVATSSMTRDIASMKKLLLQFDTHLASLKGHITPAGLRMLQDLIKAEGVVSAKSLRYGGRTMIMQGLEVMDACVWGVVVFSARSVEQYPDEWCLVYMAGEPDRPLYEYSSFSAFKRYLTQQLQLKPFQEYFAQSLDEDAKADFFKSFSDTQKLGTVRQLSITTPLFEFMVQSHVGKLQLDARKLAVPTADIDEDVRQKRLLDFLQMGVTVASVAGLFVPVLGQLMMGVAVGQLLGEVYEGVEDWRRGDHQQALSHLLSVAENIALMAAFAGGQKALGALGRKLVRSHPEFFGQFTAILNRAGKPRLWKPDLSVYERSLPAGLTVADGSTEFYRIGDKTLGRVDHRFLAGSHDSETNVWRLEHASRAQAYSPELTRHVEGGWQLPDERTEEWAGSAYPLKRIDPHLSEFVDTDLDMMRRLSDTSYETLHRVFSDNLSLPVRLRDTVERVRIGRQLSELARELQSGEIHSGQSVEEQLHALPKLPGWPTDRYIEVMRAEGSVKAAYPPTRVADDQLCVEVDEDQLAQGQLLQTVIDGLYPHEVDTLLGSKVAQGAQESALAKKLGTALEADHRAVFEHMYRRYDQSEAADVLTLRAVYAGLPQRVAQTLIDRAPSVERLSLRSADRVPLRLGQQASEQLARVRLDRALTGLHWPWIATADTDKLAIQLLSRLRGWEAGLRLVMRDKTLTGPVLEAIGAETATAADTCSLVKSGAGYEAFGGDGKSLGKVAAGPDALYTAVLKALPARQRIAVGFADPSPAEAARLRSQLLDAALAEREASAQTLVSGKFTERLVEPACIQGDQPPAINHPRALLRKVRKLYPRLSEIEAGQLLDELGDDPLSRATRVRALRQDLLKLRDALFAWSEDEAAMRALGGDWGEMRHGRKTVAEMIEEAFRRISVAENDQGESVCALNLDKMRVGKLPTLPPGVSFDHIERLSLREMEQGDDVVYFLKAFKQLESLELDHNKITRLPEVLSHMPRLGRLSLANNQLRLTEQTLVKLNGLRTLHHLNLNANPLGATPDIGSMVKLRQLLLRETGLTELPKGLELPAHLDWINLSDNQIKELPLWLFRTSRRFSQSVDLSRNPLSRTSATHLETYRKNYGVGMGYLADDIARLDEQKARSLWFTETAGEVGATRERIWTAFKEEPRAEALFHLLAVLGDTAGGTKGSADLQRRVWTVLEAAETDAGLCDQLLDIAANRMICTDSAAVNFSHLEVAVEVNRLTNAASGEITAKPLLKLLRGLFRLDQLNAIAEEHAAKVKADALEVNLAFRIGLAETMDLPGQPRHMLFSEQAKVTAADLEAAKSRVSAAELSPELLKFMLRQPFWSDYLKRTFPRQFSPIDEKFAAKLEREFEGATKLSSADYLSKVDAIKLDREQAEEAVLQRLTDDAVRLADLGICMMPEA
ncbi:NEL-type E3 ubiquitin ligase domain-containing protein [Pseudomonas sp. SWRI99]|uniref:NEL-type E3 ubiquitin ligase domain-containing protein n=1 Tax=Pseudomonas sp. SWRI99 TaxID=2745506 RepID=UPI001647213E|nr:NEL-type E3 ubiquitin ligase domain-containing protein [Pseudomonas sp. SWRI99]MBC3775804.1 hypothetical protein [Pseudomonas sp. SWRI99]